jgi:pentose-5-phosphate-3-epimerase
MIEIVPAVLPHSFDDLTEHVTRVHGSAHLVQIDVVDGIFARHKTWPYRDSATFEKIVSEEKGLPFWGEIDFEFDLMIEDPHLRAMEFVSAGGSRFVIHAGAHGAVEGIHKLAELREDTGAYSVATGLALTPDMQP